MRNYFMTRREALWSVESAERWRETALGTIEDSRFCNQIGSQTAADYYDMILNAGVSAFGNSRHSGNPNARVQLLSIPRDAIGSFYLNVDGYESSNHFSLADTVGASFRVFKNSGKQVVFLPENTGLEEIDRAAFLIHEFCHLRQVNRRGEKFWDDHDDPSRKTQDEVEAYDIMAKATDTAHNGFIEALIRQSEVREPNFTEILVPEGMLEEALGLGVAAKVATKVIVLARHFAFEPDMIDEAPPVQLVEACQAIGYI